MSTVVLEPPKTTLDPLVERVLGWVNEERIKRGLEPLEDLPQGHRKINSLCPVACGLEGGASVGSNAFGYCDEFLEWLPSYVAAFVLRYDRGEFPQYDVTSQLWLR